jgi:hypothetical protein
VFFKDEAFSDEREYRLVYTEHPEILKASKFPNARKHFRPNSRGNMLIPFVSTADLALTLPQKLPLEEITIGPQENISLVERSIREFLDSWGYSEVKLQKSRVPYRSLGTSG